MTDDLAQWERALLDDLRADEREQAAAVLASYDGPNQYQGRASLPGGAVIYAGVHGASRDRAAGDLAALFGADPRHWTVTKIPPPPRAPR